MSLSFLVILAARQVPTSDTWQSALQEHHVPLQFPHALDSPRTQDSCRSRWTGTRAGSILAKKTIPTWLGCIQRCPRSTNKGSVAFSLAFGGHGLECASAAYSAALLVARFNAVAFDPQGASFMSEQQLVETAKMCEQLGD